MYMLDDCVCGKTKDCLGKKPLLREHGKKNIQNLYFSL